MLRFVSALGPLVVLIGCASQPPSTEADRTEIQAVYDSIADGIEARDIDRVTAHSAEDARVEYADGRQLDLEDWKESARAKWANFRSAASNFVVTTVECNDPGAIVTYLESDDLVIVDPATSQQHRVEYEGEWCAQLLRTDEGWKLHRSVEQARRVKVDGKLVDETRRKP
ncbi:MAG: hypothetical protein JNL94_04330 [Planctomycetes bacterium]|nr:hypothetical protein [Planctomycetota bacterium]